MMPEAESHPPPIGNGKTNKGFGSDSDRGEIPQAERKGRAESQESPLQTVSTDRLVISARI
jgi:hypothetical protein